MAGLYVTIYGKVEDLYAVRKELETNRQKRRWVYDICGNEENFFLSMENAEIWKPLTTLIPSASGPRNLAICCIYSKDPWSGRPACIGATGCRTQRTGGWRASVPPPTPIRPSAGSRPAEMTPKCGFAIPEPHRILLGWGPTCAWWSSGPAAG